jgi:hypothetical protein
MAKHYLMRAIHIAPVDCKLRFNAALTMQVGGTLGWLSAGGGLGGPPKVMWLSAG